MVSKTLFLLSAFLAASSSALPNKRPSSPAWRRQDPEDPVDNGPTEGWEPVGCHTDQAVPRTLIDSSFADPAMTPALCTAFCEAGGYGFAGVEYGLECYCGYAIQSAASPADEEDCSFACAGDAALTCGAGNRIFVYTNGQAPPAPPPTVDTWSYKGCYTDLINSDQRSLLRVIELTEPVDINSCTAGCKAENHRLAGVEYGGECWCGDFTTSGTFAPETDCAMTCTGDRTQICGGPFRLTLYADEDPLLAPVASTTCLQTSRNNAQLRAVPKVGAGAAAPLHVVDVGDVAGTWFALTTTAPGATGWGATVDLAAGVVAVDPAVGESGALLSFSVNAGDAPVFLNAETHTVVNDGFCTHPNPTNVISPVISPLLLGTALDTASWALCPNTTAVGRLDVVYAPVALHSHYDILECEEIYIQVV